MLTEELWATRDLLGMDVILIPIPARSKAPRIKNWTNFGVGVMDDHKYHCKLHEHGNTGVLLGKASGGLCSIDIDIDEEVEKFLEINPRLQNTLQTRGQRGANLWVRIKGPVPKLTKLTRHGEAWGEWRGDGAQTVITGIHPSGIPYRYVNRVRPIEICFEEIRWPKGVAFPTKSGICGLIDEANTGPGACVSLPLTVSSEFLYPSTTTVSSTSSTSSTLLHDRGSGNAKAVEAVRAKKKFAEKYPALEKFYLQWIERVHKPSPGRRNKALIEIVTFLYQCLAPQLVLVFAHQFYVRNQVLWNDSEEQHMSEAKHHLTTLLDRYSDALPTHEAALYLELEAREKATFRIGRDLASIDFGEHGGTLFFLSCNNLGNRLGLDSRQADRILNSLIGYGVIEIVKKGTQRATGKPGMATMYRWLYSIAPHPRVVTSQMVSEDLESPTKLPSGQSSRPSPPAAAPNRPRRPSASRSRGSG